jgi:hypothetical protein
LCLWELVPPTRHAITPHRLRLGTRQVPIVRNAQNAAAAQKESIGAARATVAIATTAERARRESRANHTVARAVTIARQHRAVARDRVRGSGAAGGCARNAVAARSSTWRGIGAAGAGRRGRRSARLWFGVTMWARSSDVRRMESGSFALATTERACAPVHDPWPAPCFGWVNVTPLPTRHFLIRQPKGRRNMRAALCFLSPRITSLHAGLDAVGAWHLISDTSRPGGRCRNCGRLRSN